MPEPLVKFLTYVFLALLYLFFLRVLRAVWIELREPRAAAGIPATAGEGYLPAPDASRSRRGRRQKAERLRIVEPVERRGQDFDLGDELTVGRAPSCGVSLPDDTFVSQIHARLFRRDQDLWIEDLGSTNGTFLNDHKVSAPAVMRKGDRVKVGRTVLEVTR
ncbi:MAG: FHA domain-containing protein [Acidimicrobiaceae bacterium]|nr:FHA domain-containing protein [Acidimicrobiaceae bacterium]MBO0747941.1 FHA domain-containing protein [Acidimicrobiaceae bacterium]